MNQDKIVFSVITPAYNRKSFLPKLIESLKCQSFKKFEWIVGNDGSTDGTNEFLKKEIKKLSFPVQYLSSDKRIGKSMIDNLMLKQAEGNFILMCDSDDYFTKDAFEILHNLINTFEEKNSNLVGVIGQNLDTQGVSQTFKMNNLTPKEGRYVWNDLEEIIIGDGTICVKRSIFKDQLFPEVDFLTHEGVLLRKIYENNHFLLTTKVLKIMDRNAENSITHGKKIEYSRGSAYGIANTIDIKSFSKLSTKKKFFTVLNYFRYSMHGDIHLGEAFNRWQVLKKFRTYLLLFPLSYILCCRDIMLGKVVKTHLEFEKNKDTYELTIIKNFTETS